MHKRVAPMQHEPERFYVPQFESAEVVEERISQWTTADLTQPEWNWCGICCLAMIARSRGRSEDRATLYTAASAAGVYRREGDRVIGALHREFATFVTTYFGWAAESAPIKDADTLAQHIAADRFVIASVSPEIRDLRCLPQRSNGHLVLLYGVSMADGQRWFELHNSTGFARTNSQKSVLISEENFMRFYSGRAIIIAGR